MEEFLTAVGNHPFSAIFVGIVLICVADSIFRR